MTIIPQPRRFLGARATSALAGAFILAACAVHPAGEVAATAPPAAPTRPEAAPAPRATAPVTDTVSTHERTTTTIAPGVYVIRHEDAPDTFPQGNTTVVVGAREVLVVDSCYMPSSARKD